MARTYRVYAPRYYILPDEETSNEWTQRPKVFDSKAHYNHRNFFLYKVSNVINAMAQSAEFHQKDLAPKLRRAIVKWVVNSYCFKSGRPRIRKNGSAKFPCARAKNGLEERHHLENKASDFMLQTSSLVGWMNGWIRLNPFGSRRGLRHLAPPTQIVF